MKFLLLTAGGIGEALFKHSWFTDELKRNLCGVIMSKSTFELNSTTFSTWKELPYHFIGCKSENELQLINLIKRTKPSYLLSIQYPWILPSKILKLVDGKVLNLHNAKLPNYRGHNTISHEILNQEKLHTTSLHWVTEEVDRGSIVLESHMKISSSDTAFSLHKKSIHSAVILLNEFFTNLAFTKSLPFGIPIKGKGVYYSKNIQNKKMIPDGSSVSDIYRYSRAFHYPPHEPAFFMHGEKKIYVTLEHPHYQDVTLDDH